MVGMSVRNDRDRPSALSTLANVPLPFSAEAWQLMQSEPNVARGRAAAGAAGARGACDAKNQPSHDPRLSRTMAVHPRKRDCGDAGGAYCSLMKIAPSGALPRRLSRLIQFHAAGE